MSEYKLINNPNDPFVFPAGSSLSYPLPPMVMAERSGTTGALIRATVYINNEFTGTPSIGDWSYDSTNQTLTGFVTYDAEAPVGIPTEYQAWLIETTYDNKIDLINTIKLYLRDTDPKTSRGTVTTVQTSVGQN